MRQAMTKAVAIGLLVFLSSCDGGPRHDRRLYTKGAEARLRDSEITIETFAPTRTAKVVETRRVRCFDGTAHATVTKPKRQGEADLSPDLYGKIWGKLLAKDAFSLNVEPAAADGGLYHLIRLRLGGKQSTFSAQRKANFFGFHSQSMQARMDLLNHVVRLLGQEVKTSAVPAPAEKPKK